LDIYLRRNKSFLFVTIFFIIFSVSLAYASLTIEDEKKLGSEFYEKMEKSNILYHNVRVDNYITKIGRQIVAKIPNPLFDYRFSVINSSAINAFATPGGYVYVNMGLITLAENESELAGVLAHEIAHVSARHIADIVEKSNKINIASLAAILAGAFLGKSGDITAAVASFSLATASTLNLKYSREHEEEADRLGLSYLIQTGYDGNAMLDFLKIMRRYEFYSSNVPSYFLTHPGTDERIRYLDALLQSRFAGGGSKILFGNFKRTQTLLLLEKKNFNDNLQFFQSALAKNIEDVDSLYGLAVTQDKLGLTALSLESFQKASKLAPDDSDILRDLGIVYLKSGHPGEAMQCLRKVVDLDANDAIALSYLAKSYEAVGNSTDPEVFYSLAFAYGKTNNAGDSHYNFGIYFKKKDKWASSLFHFKEALKYFPPDSPQAKDIEQQMKPPGPPDHKNELKPREPNRSTRGVKKSLHYLSVGVTVPSWRNQDKSFP
jgi:predicted Zn-dependent protease